MEWTLAPGETADRQRLHDAFGGRRSGRVSKSGRTPQILMFSDRGDGVGGFDGWSGERYLFAGEGLNEVSQALEGQGNMAILQHQATGHTLRLFFASLGQDPRYLGRYLLDAKDPWTRAAAPPAFDGGPARSLIVFRLVPLEGEPVGVPHVDCRAQRWETGRGPGPQGLRSVHGFSKPLTGSPAEPRPGSLHDRTLARAPEAAMRTRSAPGGPVCG